MALTQEDFFDEGFMKQFPELAGTLSQTVNAMYPAEGLSQAEAEELARLGQRQNRLSAIELPGKTGSTAIGGNPFSFDISPVVNAVQDGIIKTVNAARQKRRLGDEEEYQNLTGKAKKLRERAKTLDLSGKTVTTADGTELQAAPRGENTDERIAGLIEQAKKLEQQAGDVQPIDARVAALKGKQQSAADAIGKRQDVMAEIFPDTASKLVELEKQLKTGEAEQADMLERIGLKAINEKQLLEDEQINELALLDKELENELAFLAEKTRIDNSGDGNGSAGTSAGDINNLRQIAADMTGVLDGRIVQLREAFNTVSPIFMTSDRLTEEQKKGLSKEARKVYNDLQNLKNQKQNIMNTVFDRAAVQSGLPKSQIRRLFLRGFSNDQNEESAGGDGLFLLDPNKSGAGLDYNQYINGGNE